ncbi:MAG: porin family protein [Candidatus Neomarinimicrobiota bacterium]|jgi:hypothetical protein
MKNVTKLLIVLFVLTMVTASYAQTFGIKAGLNLSNMVQKDDTFNYSENYQMNPGFHVGPTAEFSFNEFLSLEAGVLLSTKGYASTTEILSTTTKTNTMLLYLDIPVTAKINVDLGDLGVFGAFGPYLGVGLSGKAKVKTIIGNIETSGDSEITWGEDGSYNRLDFGLTMGAGVDLNSLLVGVYYNLGLINVSTMTGNNHKATHGVLALSLGYKF